MERNAVKLKALQRSDGWSVKAALRLIRNISSCTALHCTLEFVKPNVNFATHFTQTSNNHQFLITWSITRQTNSKSLISKHILNYIFSTSYITICSVNNYIVRISSKIRSKMQHNLFILAGKRLHRGNFFYLVMPAPWWYKKSSSRQKCTSCSRLLFLEYVIT